MRVILYVAGRLKFTKFGKCAVFVFQKFGARAVFNDFAIIKHDNSIHIF